MRKILALVYGIVCYVIFFATFLYLFGFMADLWVPKSVSAGGQTAHSALLINLGLVALFGIQHSIMARPTFKKWWTKWVPPPIERSTYVLIASALLIFLYRAWQPMPREIWNIQGLPGNFLWAVFFLGIVVVLASSFMINHFDLFGLRQTFLYFLGKPYTHPPFKITGFYKWARNPLMLGFLITFWSAPVMTTGRLLFAVAMTVYIFIGMYFEERNIAEYLGEPSLRYRARTPMVFPFFKKK